VINYVWLGLLVLAIGYGSWLDFQGTPTAQAPDPVVVSTFSDAEGGALALSYQMGEGRRAEVPVGIKFDKPKDAPNALTLDVKGDGSGHRLQAVFVNTSGDAFLADASATLGAADKGQTVSFDLTALTPSADNPTAKPSYPLTLQSLAVVRAPDAAPAAGAFTIDDATLVFPSKSKVKSHAEAKSWMGVLTKSSAHWAEEAISLAISLIGVIMFWLGLMRVAEQAGLVALLARALRPIMKLLFPDIPADSEAMGAIVMNVAANMLGLGNAATPLGLKAIAELQKLNENKEYASNAQCMLLAINTSSVTIITPSIIGYRAAAGSTDIMSFWPIMLGATFCSTFFAVIACKVLERLPVFKVPLPPQMRENTAEVKA